LPRHGAKDETEQTDASTIPPPHPSEGTEDSQQSSKEADAHDQPSSIDEKDGDGTGADPDLADVPDHAEYVRRLFAKGSSLGPRNLLLGTVSAKPKLSAYEDFLRYGATHTVEEIAAAFQTHNPATAAKAGHSRQLRKRISNRYSECKDRIASHRNMGTSKRLLVEGFHKAKIRNGVTLRKDLLAGQRRMAKEGEESSGATPKGEDSSGATPKADSSSERS
jgi:hypothetical protein